MKNGIKRAEMDLIFPVIEEIIKNGQTAKIKVSGTSMYPLVQHRRDSVVLKKAGELKLGDVPLFRRSDGHYVLHRIVKIKDGNYGTMGDFETEVEYPVKKDMIVAVAKGFYRKGKYIPCEGKSYKIYWRVWNFLRPIRPILLKIIPMIGKLKLKLKGGK